MFSEGRVGNRNNFCKRKHKTKVKLYLEHNSIVFITDIDKTYF